MEPRARASRHKSSVNFGEDLETMLYAFGAPSHPDLTLGPLPDQTRSHDPDRHKQYPETVRVLDEILTDFIIETCHDAVAIATYSGRAKLKLADFEWAIRKDARKLGHVHAMMQKKRALDSERKAFDVAAVGGEPQKLAVDNLQGLGEAVGEEGTGKGKGRGRGRRKKRKTASEEQENGVVDATATRRTEDIGDDSGLMDVDLDLDLDMDDRTDDGRASKRAKSYPSDG